MTYIVYYQRCGISRVAVVTDAKNKDEASQFVKNEFGEQFIEITQVQPFYNNVIEVK